MLMKKTNFVQRKYFINIDSSILYGIGLSLSIADEQKPSKLFINKHFPYPEFTITSTNYLRLFYTLSKYFFTYQKKCTICKKCTNS